MLFFQYRAKPPPVFVRGTIKTLSAYSFEHSFFKKPSFDLVSMRKMMDGEYFLTISVSSRTARGWPNPRQFQLRQFIVDGGAGCQPPPLRIVPLFHPDSVDDA